MAFASPRDIAMTTEVPRFCTWQSQGDSTRMRNYESLSCLLVLPLMSPASFVSVSAFAIVRSPSRSMLNVRREGPLYFASTQGIVSQKKKKKIPARRGDLPKASVWFWPLPLTFDPFTFQLMFAAVRWFVNSRQTVERFSASAAVSDESQINLVIRALEATRREGKNLTLCFPFWVKNVITLK